MGDILRVKNISLYTVLLLLVKLNLNIKNAHFVFLKILNLNLCYLLLTYAKIFYKIVFKYSWALQRRNTNKFLHKKILNKLY